MYDNGNTIVYWTARGCVSNKDWLERTRAAALLRRKVPHAEGRQAELRRFHLRQDAQPHIQARRGGLFRAFECARMAFFGRFVFASRKYISGFAIKKTNWPPRSRLRLLTRRRKCTLLASGPFPLSRTPPPKKSENKTRKSKRRENTGSNRPRVCACAHRHARARLE